MGCQNFGHFRLVRALFRCTHANDTRTKPCESPASFEFQLFVAVLDSLAPSLDSERNALEDPALMSRNTHESQTPGALSAPSAMTHSIVHSVRKSLCFHHGEVGISGQRFSCPQTLLEASSTRTGDLFHRCPLPLLAAPPDMFHVKRHSFGLTCVTLSDWGSERGATGIIIVKVAPSCFT